MKYGGFAGGLASGISSGFRLGSMIKESNDKDRLREISEKGIAEAKAARGEEIGGMIGETPSSQPAATLGITANKTDSLMSNDYEKQNGDVFDAMANDKAGAPKMDAEERKFEVKGRSFKSREDAYKYAETLAPSLSQKIHETMVPKYTEELMKQGKLEKAKAWEEYSKSEKYGQRMENYAKAVSAASFGDYEGAAKHMLKLHTEFGDGLTVTGHEAIKGKDGEVLGFKVDFKNDKTGKDQTMNVDPEKLVRLGLSAMEPTAAFKLQYNESNAASTARMEAAKKSYETARDHKNKVEIVGIEHKNKLAQQRAKGSDGGVGKAPHIAKTADAVWKRLANDPYTKHTVIENGETLKKSWGQLTPAQRRKLTEDVIVAQRESARGATARISGGKSAVPRYTR